MKYSEAGWRGTKGQWTSLEERGWTLVGESTREMCRIQKGLPVFKGVNISRHLLFGRPISLFLKPYLLSFPVIAFSVAPFFPSSHSLPDSAIAVSPVPCTHTSAST